MRAPYLYFYRHSNFDSGACFRPSQIIESLALETSSSGRIYFDYPNVQLNADENTIILFCFKHCVNNFFSPWQITSTNLYLGEVR